MATQSMRFSQNNNSFELTQAYSDKSARMVFWYPSMFSSGAVDLSERELIELRNWTNKQIRAIAKMKKDQSIKK